MSAKMTAFFKPKPKVPEPEMLYWKTTKIVKDTTAYVQVDVKARVGSFVQHIDDDSVHVLAMRYLS